MQDEQEYFYQITKEIQDVFGKIFATRPYIAILDGLGNILHIDEPLSNQHLNFIQEFVQKNFSFLKVGDYSFPLGGINLGFFKVSPKAIICLYTSKGLSGQLLAFKARMHEWSAKIDEKIGDLSIPTKSIFSESKQEEVKSVEPATTAPKPALGMKKGFRDVPVLIKKLRGKEKFPIEVAQVLNLCDGKHSIEEICMKTNYNIVKVKDILYEYEKKKWIKHKRILS
ncbi:MAG: hypothetical protein ACTSQI_06585 [Candidatus Helarchaeota archaeon]